MQKTGTNVVKMPTTSHKLHLFAIPYFIWLLLLAVLPVIFMFVWMFVDTEGVKFQGLEFTLENFTVVTDKSTVIAFLNSLKYSFITTIICAFFGYLVAYCLYQSKLKNKYLVLLLMILPMWTNILLRINAIASIFKPNNILVDLLGMNGYGLNIIGTDWAIILGMVFTYLPFMVLPIYTSLEKIDPLLLEAATDLGSTPLVKFWTVTFPLSFKGIVSGSIMVLLPCLSGFAIPKILGDGKVILIGNIIESYFSNTSYNVGSVLAILMLVIILGAILLVNKFDKEGDTLI